MIDDIGLAGVLSHIDAVKQWCQRVEEDALATMLAGRKIPGWKLVSGREGPRKWTDEEAADTLLKGMKLPVDQRYTKKLLTPAQAQKIFKTGGISERQWLKLEALTQRLRTIHHVKENYARRTSVLPLSFPAPRDGGSAAQVRSDGADGAVGSVHQGLHAGGA